MLWVAVGLGLLALILMLSLAFVAGNSERRMERLWQKEMEARQMRDAHSTIVLDDGRWWFYDEVWAERYGPYDSYVGAKRALELYAIQLEGGKK